MRSTRRRCPFAGRVRIAGVRTSLSRAFLQLLQLRLFHVKINAVMDLAIHLLRTLSGNLMYRRTRHVAIRRKHIA